MLQRLKLSTKINLAGLALIFCFLLVLIWLYHQFNDQMYAARYAQIRQVVETAHGVADHFADQAAAGKLSPGGARHLAKEALRDLRHNQVEYFFIVDTDFRMVMHPVSETGLEGTHVSDLKDAHGKLFIREMVATARAEGGGFVRYDWPKPGGETPLPKITFAKLLPDWNWVICSGVYMDDIAARIGQTTRTVGIVLAAILLLALILSWFMAGSIARPIRRIAKGIDSGALQVAAAADEVSSASQALSQNAAQQAASIQETSASIEQMRAMSSETSQLTQGAEALMGENISKSGQSLKALIDLTREMGQIESDSGQMADIMKVIDEIAFQTNLLALNAAIEAARAGEAGAGFAVVADEVRRLAMKAAEAASGTQDLIEATVQRVTGAAGAIKKINADFEGIIESATLMGEKTGAITQASLQNAKGLDEIGQAAGEIDLTTQQTAASSQETAASAEELSAQAAEMTTFAAQMMAIVDGGNSRRQ